MIAEWRFPVARPFHLHDHTTRLFDSGGDGPPLVLRHALGLDWRMWSRVIALLTPHYRVIAYDLRGFGGAAFAPQVRDLAHYAGDVADLLDRLNLPQARIAGLSLGGSIALELALQRDRVTDLTVIAATAWSSPLSRNVPGPPKRQAWRPRSFPASSDGSAPAP